MLLDEIEKENKDIQKKSEVEFENKLFDYKNVFLNDVGQRVFGDLQYKFNTRPSYEPGTDAKDMCYYEGQKSVIHYIYTLLTYEQQKGN